MNFSSQGQTDNTVNWESEAQRQEAGQRKKNAKADRVRRSRLSRAAGNRGERTFISKALHLLVQHKLYRVKRIERQLFRSECRSKASDDAPLQNIKRRKDKYKKG